GHPGRVRGNPVLWREQKVEGIAPLYSLRRWPRPVGMAVVGAGSAASLQGFLAAFPAEDAFFWHGLAALVFLTFVVAIRFSGSITGEKEKGTWEALLLTPLTTAKIVEGKHWGIFWACVPYIVSHAAAALTLGAIWGPGPLAWAVLWVVLMVPAV